MIQDISAGQMNPSIRPEAHFHPPENWMNDPNGPVYHKGYFHLFYQCNPFGNRWGNIHWGHARSRNLREWEHLPPALSPWISKGEQHCFSGSTFIDSSGNPLIFYSSIGNRYPEVWAAVGDSELIHWKRENRNPVLTVNEHSDAKPMEWRDPFIFTINEKVFMLMGGAIKGIPSVFIYEADQDLFRWKYRGIFYQHRNHNLPGIECPNLFRLREKWLLVFSAHGPVEYGIGKIDKDNYRFISESEGLFNLSENFYATNGCSGPEGELIIWGWVKGFINPQRWNGCLSFPLTPAVSDSGLTLLPHRSVNNLFTDLKFREQLMDNGQKILFPEMKKPMFSIRLKLPGDSNQTIQIRGSASCIPITIEEGKLSVNRKQFRVDNVETTGKELIIYLDNSLLEIFMPENGVFLTEIVPCPEPPIRIHIPGKSEYAINLLRPLKYSDFIS